MRDAGAHLSAACSEEELNTSGERDTGDIYSLGIADNPNLRDVSAAVIIAREVGPVLHIRKFVFHLRREL
jgi:hypothetical protein